MTSGFDIDAALAAEAARNDQMAAAMREHSEQGEVLITEAAKAIAGWVMFLHLLGASPENIMGSVSGMTYRAIREVADK